MKYYYVITAALFIILAIVLGIRGYSTDSFICFTAAVLAIGIDDILEELKEINAKHHP